MASLLHTLLLENVVRKPQFLFAVLYAALFLNIFAICVWEHKTAS